jgi:segregation and condensation protein B
MSENTVTDDTTSRARGNPGLRPHDLGPALEAVLLSLDKPIAPAKLAEAMGIPGPEPVEIAIRELNEAYESSGRSFRIEKVAGGYRVMTLPVFAPVLAAFHRARAGNKLGRAAIETLSIIAYKQPITRAHLEAIRGVSCGEILRSLLDRRLITIKGRAEELGRPLLYGTTKEFLDAFGLATLKDLPTATELQGTA